MESPNRRVQPVALLVLAAYLVAYLAPPSVGAQVNDCGYDPAKPSLEHARLNFKITNYDCAEQEVNDLLKIDTLNLQTRADAHVLLAAVYYAKVQDSDEKKKRVLEQFVQAFRAYQDWRGELDIRSPEFETLMQQAKEMVEKQKKAREALAGKVPEETALGAATPVAAAGGKKPFYTQWWFLGLGVGLVAAGVLVAGGGGGAEASNELPPFPPRPGQ